MLKTGKQPRFYAKNGFFVVLGWYFPSFGFKGNKLTKDFVSWLGVDFLPNFILVGLVAAVCIRDSRGRRAAKGG